MAFLITMLIFFVIVIIISIVLTGETNGDSLLVALAFFIIGWLMIEHKTVKTADPVPVDICELSIMVDDEVAIIRYDGKNYTYDNVTEYNAIKNSSFSFMEIKEYDILGEHNDSTFELMVNKVDHPTDIIIKASMFESTVMVYPKVDTLLTN